MTACASSNASHPGETKETAARLDTLIPVPVSVTPEDGTFTLTAKTRIYVDDDSPVAEIGKYLAEALRPATEFELPVEPLPEIPVTGHIILTTENANTALGKEGYELTVTEDRITVVAPQPVGLFWGVQTLRQLLPPSIERKTAHPGPWEIPACTVRDYPRFAWRGLMIDVARHFFTADEVKHYIDLMARYKMNRLHLHLTDDQGWRIMIDAWPQLAEHGGSTAVNGEGGGFYTQEKYAEIVAYAQERQIMVVPEIDMPSHTNAALASYPELNCDGQAPELYTGTEVGFSSLCVGKDVTYDFVDDVIGEVAALTPGPYIHIGGDEAHSTEHADYVLFIERVQDIVTAHGKTTIGWEEIAKSVMAPDTIVQQWHSGDQAKAAVEQGNAVILSPASRVYLDMKYTSDTELGLDWAGTVEVQQAYAWDPATEMDGVTEVDMLGIEAAVWTETLNNTEDLDYMVFPRLLGHAETGWSPQDRREWVTYRERLSAHGPRLEAMKISFYRSPQVSWGP